MPNAMDQEKGARLHHSFRQRDSLDSLMSRVIWHLCVRLGFLNCKMDRNLVRAIKKLHFTLQDRELTYS